MMEAAVPGKIFPIESKFLHKTDHADGDKRNIHMIIRSSGLPECYERKPTAAGLQLEVPVRHSI
jgi:hypothetical protein